MFFELKVYVNTPEREYRVPSRSEDTVRALKERIINKANLGPVTINLMTMPDYRDLNRDDMQVGKMGINNGACLLAVVRE